MSISRTWLRRTLLVVCAAGLLGGGPATYAAGSSGGGGAPSIPLEARPKSPEQAAAVAYKKGLRLKERAWGAEKRAASATNEKRRNKYLQRAERDYTKAIQEFGAALRNLPEHYEAANELGYALRKTGNFEKAIGAYNLALNLNPDFLEAIEYRGEALLALGYYDETKNAYLRLFREDATLADQLMTAMRDWAGEQQEPSVKARAFLEWLDERDAAAALGEQVGKAGASGGW